MQTKFLIGLLCFTMISISIHAQTLDDARQNLQQKRYVAAVDICNQLLVDSPNDPDIFSVRSLLYTAMGRYDQATQDADKALLLNNTSGQAYYAKAEVLYGLKDYNRALQEYNAAIASNAQMPEAYAGKARTYMGLQNYKEAMKVTEDALKNFPNDVELHFTHGLLNNQRGKPKLAVADYDKVLSINPKWNTFQVYLNRGIANEAYLDHELAIQDFSKAIALDPNSSSAYMARGNVHYVMARYEEAVTDFKRAEILSPDNSVITYNIGMAYYKNEDKASACKYFQKSCSQGNSNACKMVVLNCSDRKIN